MKREKNIELLSPAGSLEKLETAIYFGADSVYLAGKQFGLRAQADNFDVDGLFDAVKKLHSAKKQMLVTVNIFAKNADFSMLNDYLEILENVGVDAIIVSDLGIMDFTMKHFPALKIHISTQANTLNKYAARFYADMGAKRIVLARELSLSEIREIRDYIPSEVELETFAHGAMCISYSGRCLLSNYLSKRDANRGECVQACRWEYTIKEKNADSQNELEIIEDNRGTYILNSRDLNMIEHIDKLYDAGINSLKIEGRAKTAYYVATVTNAYRRAIDIFKASKGEFVVTNELKDELNKAANRTYTTGFYFSSQHHEENTADSSKADTQNLETSAPKQRYDFIALVHDYDAHSKRALIEMRNRFKVDDVLEVLSPSDSFNKIIRVEEMSDMNGSAVVDASRVQQKLYLKTDTTLAKGDILRKKRIE